MARASAVEAAVVTAADRNRSMEDDPWDVIFTLGGFPAAQSWLLAILPPEVSGQWFERKMELGRIP